MQEHTGTPAIGQAAEAIKERVDTLNQMKELVDSLDMEDIDTWAAHINNNAAMFMANSHQLPELAYALSKLLMQVIRHADSIEDEPFLKFATRMAVAKVFNDQIRSEEVTENEICND